MTIRLCAITYLDAGILVVTKNGDAVIVPLDSRPADNELWISTDDRITHARKRAILSESIKSIDYFGRDLLVYARLITRKGESVLDAIARLVSRIFMVAVNKLGISELDLISRMRASHAFSSVIIGICDAGAEVYIDHKDDALPQELDHASVIQDHAFIKKTGACLQAEPHRLLTKMQAVRLPAGVLREIYFQSEGDLIAWLKNTDRPFLFEVSFSAVGKALKEIYKPGYFLRKQWLSYAGFQVLSGRAKMKIERCLIADYYKSSGQYMEIDFDSIDILSVSSGIFASCVLDSMIASSRSQFEDEDSRILRRFWFSSALRSILTDISMSLAEDGVSVRSFNAGSINVDTSNIDIQSLVSVAYKYDCEII